MASTPVFVGRRAIFLMVHVVGELRQLFGGDPQPAAGVLAHGGHNLIIDVGDELLRLAIQPVSGVMDRTVHAFIERLVSWT
jgi:hypothetical protein